MMNMKMNDWGTMPEFENATQRRMRGEKRMNELDEMLSKTEKEMNSLTSKMGYFDISSAPSAVTSCSMCC